MLWEMVGMLFRVVGMLWEIVGMLFRVVGMLWEIVGMLFRVVGMLWEIVGLLFRVVGMHWEIVGMLICYTCMFITSLLSCRKVVVEGPKVTSAIWGAFDQYIVTGHEDGTVAKYNILKV